jgi:transposase InsO family protein
VAALNAIRARATGPTRDEAASAIKRRPEVGSEVRSDAVAAVEAWMRTYNHERPHQALGWLTPAEKRANNLGCEKVAA